MSSTYRLPSRGKLALAWFFASLPATLLYAVLTPLAVNIPIWDDYDAALDFLNHLVGLPSLSARWIYALTAQHNQYKLYFVNGFLWLQYTLFGALDFRWAARFSNLLLLPVIFVLWRFFLPRQQDRFVKLVLFIPVSCLWFQLNYAETVNWAVSAYQTLPVLVAVFLAILFLHRETRLAMGGALVCLVAAVFSSGSGFILPIIGGVLLLRRRRFVALAVWYILTLACTALYACHYTFLRLEKAQPLPFVSENLRRLAFAITFLGAGTGYLIPSFFLGAFLFLFWVHMSRRGYFQRQPQIGWSVAFIGLVALLVAFGRADGGVRVALLSRYRLYSDLLLIFTWMAIADEYLPAEPDRVLLSPLVRVALPLSALFALTMDTHGVSFLHKRNAWLRSGMTAWQERASQPPMDPPQNVVLPEPGQPPQDAERNAWDRRATLIMEDSIRLGTYRPPPPAP